MFWFLVFKGCNSLMDDVLLVGRLLLNIFCVKLLFKILLDFVLNVVFLIFIELFLWFFLVLNKCVCFVIFVGLVVFILIKFFLFEFFGLLIFLLLRILYCVGFFYFLSIFLGGVVGVF